MICSSGELLGRRNGKLLGVGRRVKNCELDFGSAEQRVRSDLALSQNGHLSYELFHGEQNP